MSVQREDLRKAVGRALRRVREEWQLSLDDVEQASTSVGVRVSRSHLSRVENGQADLALPRFLSLMRAVGEPPGQVVESLDALLADDVAVPRNTSTVELGARAIAQHDMPLAARLFRQAARAADEPLPPATLELWARAEGALGRWQAARRVLQLALGPSGKAGPRVLYRLAVACLGCRQPGVALPLVQGSGAPRLLVELVDRVARIEMKEALDERHLAGFDRLAESAPAPWREVVPVVRSEIHRRRGQLCLARMLAESAAVSQTDPIRGAEAHLARVRTEVDARRPAAGLRALDRARVLSRQAGVPDLLARCHGEAARLHRLASDRDGVRDALRAARALLRRSAADRDAPPTLPLHALMQLADGVD